MYAYAFSGSWSTMVAKMNTNCKGTAIALDSNDKTHIAYSYYDNNGYLGYAKYDNGWTTQVLANLSSMTFGVDIAIDSNDFAHIVSTNNSFTNGIVYFNNTANNGNTWTELDLDSTTRIAGEISLKIDSIDNLHICYLDNNNQNLKYATNSSGNWNYYSIHDEQNESAGLHNQLELYGGKVHFAYSISNTIGYTMSLGYATFDGNSVEKKTVDDIQNVGQSTDLVISSLGEIFQFHILMTALIG